MNTGGKQRILPNRQPLSKAGISGSARKLHDLAVRRRKGLSVSGGFHLKLRIAERARTRFHGRCLMKPVTESASFTLMLDPEERAELLRFLEQALIDTHVEARRTEDPDYQDQVHHREDLLRGLIGKLRQT
jgi:hypothetical protein